MVTTSIKCDKCGNLFASECEKFFTIRGNIMIGLQGGLIGNNFDKNDVCIRENHYCESCLRKILFERYDKIKEAIDEKDLNYIYDCY